MKLTFVDYSVGPKSATNFTKEHTLKYTCTSTKGRQDYLYTELTGSDKQVRKEIQVTKSECTSGKGRQEEKLTQNIKETNLQNKTGNDGKRRTKKNFKETQMGWGLRTEWDRWGHN